jgi:hypothetical protein
LVATSIDTIVLELRMNTDPAGGYRVPPLLCSRLARGGKTTLLCLIFDALKQCNIFPIFVTFNGSSNFQSREGESQTQAILRSIALQLVDTAALDPRCLVCDEKALDEYLGNMPVVLIIDELNARAAPVDEDAGRMLRQLFLDKCNRYLVFSSHVPMNLESNALTRYMSSNSISASLRGCHVISFSPCLDMTLLRRMSPSCSSLSPAEVAVYGGIPSLIYSVKVLREMSPSVRIHRKLPPGALGSNKTMFAHFVASLLDGFRREELKDFDEYGILTHADRITWPLCYVEHLLLAFELDSEIRFMVTNIQSLYTHASSVETGKDWECLVNLAVALRCLQSSRGIRSGPFDMLISLPPCSMASGEKS